MMRLKMSFVISFVLAFVVMLGCGTVSALAATGCQGYAIHRDGAFLGTTWHAGLMDKASASDSLPVMHIGGLKGGVTLCSWDTFIDGKNFKGVYKPKSAITSSGRDLIVSMGRKLKTEDLGYTPLSQIDHFVTDGDKWVYASDLWLIRCDGVVEYSYEWYGYRIYGNDSLWDITRGGGKPLAHHAAALVTPKSQAQSYMELVQDTKP